MSQRRFQPLDRTAGGLSAALIMMISLTILAGVWEGVRVNLTGLDEHGEIGPYAPIVLSFSDPVDQKAVQSLFSIQPNIPGSIEWPDPKTLRFVPLKPLQPDIDYRITLEAGHWETMVYSFARNIPGPSTFENHKSYTSLR